MKSNSPPTLPSPSVIIAPTAIVDDSVKFIGSCHVGAHSSISSGSVIKNSRIGAHCTIENSVVEQSTIQNHVSIGPFAHIRPNCKISHHVRIGNFVEIKNARIGSHSKIAHLAYVADASVGPNTNIGCGVIFANFSGRQKQKITVGKGCFIGSNSNLIAPLKIGAGSYICAGTTLTRSTRPNDFVIARPKETIKPHRAKAYLGKEEK